MSRSLLVFAFTLVIGLVTYPLLISWLTARRAGQRVAEYGLRSHAAKAGTPTMGGLLFVGVTVLAWVVFDRSSSGWFVVFALSAGAALGFLDDLANVRGEGALGLLGRQKLVLQAVIGVLVGVGLIHVGQTRELLPFFGSVEMGWLIIPLATLAIMAASNAVNLTDGVDGLAGVCSVLALGATWVIAVHLNQRSGAFMSAALVGGVLAFLAYNWFPARVFMGDTGSMALGCVLVVIAAEMRLLWMLPLLGVVFVAETLSVIINITALKRFNRRVFRASPLHHHFELGGLREQRLVLGFAAVAAAGALLTVALVLPTTAPG